MPYKLTTRGSSTGPLYDDLQDAIRYAKRVTAKEGAMVEIWHKHDDKTNLAARVYQTGQVILTEKRMWL